MVDGYNTGMDIDALITEFKQKLPQDYSEEFLKEKYRLHPDTKLERNLLIRFLRRKGLTAAEILKHPTFSDIKSFQTIYDITGSPAYTWLERQDTPDLLDQKEEPDK
jgi:hypothetical protein